MTAIFRRPTKADANGVGSSKTTRRQIRTAVSERGPSIVDGTPGGVIALRGWATEPAYTAATARAGNRCAVTLTPDPAGNIRPDPFGRVSLRHLLRGYDATRETTCTRQADGTLIVSVEAAP